MISIPEKVEELVNRSPYIREAIADGLINLSALARKIKPEVENELYKKVSIEAVLIALQRLSKTMQPYNKVNPADYLANLSLRSGLFEITIKNSPTLLKKLSEIAKKVSQEHAIIFIFTQGLNETTVITSSTIKKSLIEDLRNEKISSTLDNLTGISLQRMPGMVERTGVLHYPLRILAWQGISVIEIYTTLNDITVIVRDFEVDRAIISLRQSLKKAET